MELKYRLFSNVLIMILIYFSWEYGFETTMTQLLGFYFLIKAVGILMLYFKKLDKEEDEAEREYRKRVKNK